MSHNSSINANSIIEETLNNCLAELEKNLKADVLAYIGPIMDGVDSEIRDALEFRTDKKNKLVVILETGGGYIEVAERIANTFRKHYEDCVEFIVPNFAMSAGTVLVMSGDA